MRLDGRSGIAGGGTGYSRKAPIMVLKARRYRVGPPRWNSSIASLRLLRLPALPLRAPQLPK